LRAIGSGEVDAVPRLHHRCDQLRCRAPLRPADQEGGCISSIRCIVLAGTSLLQPAVVAASAGLAANARAATGSAIDDPNSVAGEGTSLPPAACS